MKITSDGLQILIVLFAIALVPGSLVLYYLHTKNRGILSIAGSGAVAWLVASVRSPVLHFVSLLAGKPSTPPVWFIGFSAVLAGVFEEGVRYLFLKFSVEDRSWEAGVAFGLGAGLIEMILIYCIPLFRITVFGRVPPAFAQALPGAIERNLAVLVHIGAALLVMHSLRVRWMLGVAVFYHSLLDFTAPVLGYHSSFTVWQVESVIALFAAIGLIVALVEKHVLRQTAAATST